MFANTQMTALSPLRSLGEMAHRTTDVKALRVIQAGLEAMLSESKNLGVFQHDHATAQVDLNYVKSLVGQ